MAYTFDPYDPDEIRRRTLLYPTGEETPPEEMPQRTGEEPQPEAMTGSASEVPTVQGKISLSPAQQKYKDTLSTVPSSTNYKPSKWRRFAAAVAGGLAGAADPRMGASTAQSIISAPYHSAMNNWQNSVKATAGEAGVEQKAIDEDIARQRASAYGRIATSREEAAAATEKFRQYQQQHTPWEPTTKEEYLQVHPHNPPVWAPANKQEYMEVHPHNPAPPSSLDVERLRHTNRMSEQAARDNRIATLRRDLAKNRKTGAPATPQQQLQAEHLAAQQIIRNDPRYASFYDPGDPAKRLPPRIKGIADLPKEAGTGLFGSSGVSPAEASLSRELYRQFLGDLDKKKKEILGSKNPTNSGEEDWEIQQDDEDDQ